MSFSLIAAIAENNCIGKGNKLPWNIPEDLEHFRALTKGKTCLMGQATFESILGYLGKPLPGRKTAVLTLDKQFTAPEGVRIFYSLDDAWRALKDEDVFICGGASIYRQTIDRADTLHITHIRRTVDGDAFFPDINPDIWQKADEEEHGEFSFTTYKKR
jgi:dihydrofolate reductase